MRENAFSARKLKQNFLSSLSNDFTEPLSLVCVMTLLSSLPFWGKIFHSHMHSLNYSVLTNARFAQSGLLVKEGKAGTTNGSELTLMIFHNQIIFISFLTVCQKISIWTYTIVDNQSLNNISRLNFY